VTGAPRVVRAGLTGGLASGKSTVAAILRALGAFHLDADAIVHETLAPGGAAHAPVVARFGPAIVRPDGTIDRNALAARVFADPAELSALNAIVHPLVRAEIARRIAAAAAAPAPPPVAIVDAPLLVEAGMHRDLDALIVVACRPETQIARAVARGGMTESEARARVAAQAPLDAKLALADYVIDTDGTLADTDRRTRDVWDRLLAESRG
jgi:dephospho-CoA kinase